MSKDALPFQKFSAFKADPMKIILIEDQESKLYDRRIEEDVLGEDFQNLVKSIEKYGQLQPIRVRKDGVEQDGAPRVVCMAGRRRLRAIRHINENRGAAEPLLVQCVYGLADDRGAFATMVAENHVRLDENPADSAEKALRFVTTMGADRDEACVAFGVTKITMDKWLRFATMNEAVRNAVRSGRVSMGFAMKLVDFPSDQQEAKMEELIASGNTSAAAADSAMELAAAEPEGKGAAAEATGAATEPKRVTKIPKKGVGAARVRKVLLALKASEDVNISQDTADALAWVAGSITDATFARKLGIKGDLPMKVAKKVKRIAIK